MSRGYVEKRPHYKLQFRTTSIFITMCRTWSLCRTCAELGAELGVKSQGRVAQIAFFRKKIVPKLAMMW